ncbi:DegV family EDD domain-containing protein [Candidatus Bipolaricaulota bacterium]|nr:DegV family EDD domain-containing protein [Candidatus Bipolaricaulota bacterium]
MATTRPAGIAHLTGDRLRRAVAAGARKVIASADQLDQINVFPVADFDTGKNLATTMWAILQELRGVQRQPVAEVSQAVAQAALHGARGNSGVIVAQFFQGLAEGLAGKLRVDVPAFAHAVRRAAERSWEALATPKEGTILSVISAFAARVEELARGMADFVPLVKEGFTAAEAALERTRGALPALRAAGVVDAGALGFVRFLQGIIHYIATGHTEEVGRAGVTPTPEKAQVKYDPAGVAFRYCTECTVRGVVLPQDAVKEALSTLGDSVVVAGSATFLHLHVHTNTPARVVEVARGFGEVAEEKVDDMWAQHTEAAGEAVKGELVVVVDTSCDLPEFLMTRYRIPIVPLRVRVGGQEFKDRIELTAHGFYQRMKEGADTGTSQPPPGDFLDMFRHLGQHYSGVLAVLLAKDLSGTWSVAAQAAGELAREGIRVEVVDSGTLSGGLALVTWATANGVQAGLGLAAAGALARECSRRVRFWAALPDLRPLARSGRVPWAAGWLTGRARLGLVVAATGGKIHPVAPALGTGGLVGRLAALAGKAMADMERPAVIIPHAMAIGAAEALAGRIAEARRSPGLEVHLVDASPALGVHAGLGAFGVGVLDMGWVDRRIAELGGHP